MKLISLIFTLSSVVSWGSGTGWITVHLPTHVLFVDEGPPGGVTEVPCVTSASSSFERVIGLMNSPYVPHHTVWNVPADTNLITLYGLIVSGAYDMKSDPKNPKLVITIDCANSVRPKGYPFSIDEVVEKVKACVTLNFNPETIKVRPKRNKEERVGAGQPAMAPELKPEGEEKSQPEAKVRAR
ncbi:MAG: hypothetical protein ACSHYF_07800 [Verrucomicrobiaceae bacterium]